MRFADRALQLAGLAGAWLGWTPDVFWQATPAEVGAVIAALRGEEAGAPPDPMTLARMRELFPDG